MILQFPSARPPAPHKEAWLAEARRQRDELEFQLVERDRLEQELFAAHATVRPWDPPDTKARLWEAEQLLPMADEAIEQQVRQVTAIYRELIEQLPECDEARHDLLDLCWRLLCRAEERRMPTEELLQKLEQHDDGRYLDLIEGTATLTVETDPPGARVRIYRLTEQARQLRAQERRELGRSPVGPVDLEPGSYLLEIKISGYAPTRRPVKLPRGSDLRLHVSLFGSRQVGPDFVPIAAGRFEMGGDRAAPGAGPLTHAFVDNFAIGRYPVTVGEYLIFLDDLAERDPARALRFTPRYGVAETCDPRLPVTGVSYEAAVAYCEWLSSRSGIVHRLPSEQEWEKAARGVDGRWYPWGDSFDSTDCLMRDSYPGDAALRPVGGVATDTSIYGVRDVAGVVGEWTESYYDDSRAYRVVRGGSFIEGADACRCARRAAVAPERQASHVGFRLVRSLPPGGGDELFPANVPAPDLPTPELRVGGRPRRIDIGRARDELLEVARAVAKQPAPDAARELLATAVQLVGAERGFLIDTAGERPIARLTCNAVAAAMPTTDRRFDEELVDAALRQRRTIELSSGHPRVAVPLCDHRHCLLLERRFSASRFAEAERVLIETAADLITLPVRLLQVEPSAQPPLAHRHLDEAVVELERHLLSEALAVEKGNISRTARRLGLSRNGLRARLRRYNLSPLANA